MRTRRRVWTKELGDFSRLAERMPARLKGNLRLHSHGHIYLDVVEPCDSIYNLPAPPRFTRKPRL